MEKKTSIWENSVIWFGAAVSLAEIFSGTLFAPLGFTKGMEAILLGHGICFVIEKIVQKTCALRRKSFFISDLLLLVL